MYLKHFNEDRQKLFFFIKSGGEEGETIILVNEVFNPIEPGISSYADNPSQVVNLLFWNSK